MDLWKRWIMALPSRPAVLSLHDNLTMESIFRLRALAKNRSRPGTSVSGHKTPGCR